MLGQVWEQGGRQGREQGKTGTPRLWGLGREGWGSVRHGGMQLQGSALTRDHDSTAGASPGFSAHSPAV